MSRPSRFSYRRYLDAKRTVDDRALNAAVWGQLLELAGRRPPGTVLEVGAGTGTMARRLDGAGLRFASYTALDRDPENVAALRERLAEPKFETVEADLFAWLGAAATEGRRFDLVVACAVLDLLPLERAVEVLAGVLERRGLLYLPIHFDGVTAFEPTLDAELDATVERLYHRTMDERLVEGVRSGDSRTGRHLFTALGRAGLEVVAAGASDWVVWPGRDGYPADEAWFLHYIVDTVRGALVDDVEAGELDGAVFGRWVAARHAQIERGELIYVAHQLDLLARLP